MTTSLSEDEEATFALIRRYFADKDLSAHNKSSFDFFLHHRLPRIIEEEPSIEVQMNPRQFYTVRFGPPFVEKPYIVDERRTVRYITPNEARLRDLTYASTVSINVTATTTTLDEQGQVTKTERKEWSKVPIARLPMMLYASKCNLYHLTNEQRVAEGECKFDDGGYFIIKGKERVLVAQERINYNIVYVFEPKVNSKYSHIAEVRSMSEETGHSVLLQLKCHHTAGQTVTLSLPYLQHDMSLGQVLVAFGYDWGRIEKLCLAQLPVAYHGSHTVSLWLRALKKEMAHAGTKAQALEDMAQYASYMVSPARRTAFVNQILHNEMLPHLGIASLPEHKIMFLLHMWTKLLAVVVGYQAFDDRDHLMNKRIEVSGVLVAELFRTLYKRFIRAIEPQLTKRPDIMMAIGRVNVITQGLKHCFSTGNWGIPKSSYMRTGVSQVLSRLTYLGTLSHLRRVLIPVGKEGKNTKIRQLHASQMGYFCPSETPEGHSAGIVKNLSLVCEVSPRYDAVYVRSFLETLSEIENDVRSAWDVARGFRQTSTKIFYNGILFGWIQCDPKTFYAHLLDRKMHNQLHYTVSISWCEAMREIHLFADEGRLLRPLWNTSKMPTATLLRDPATTWDTLRENGHLRWVDPHEMENRTVATTPQEIRSEYDSCEIHPSLMLGICVNLIPFPEHTQSPRLCYVASMSKQALGVYASNHNVRSDTVTYVLHNGEQPIVKTHYSDISGYNQLVAGNNLIVAIACYSGFNQEDSVIMNQSSIDRGLFRTSQYKTVMVEEKKRSSNSVESIMLVPPEHRIRSYHYGKLRPDGIVRRGVFVGQGDVVVGRIISKPTKSGKEIHDSSHVVKSGEEGYVDKVFVSTSPDGYKVVKIRIRQTKIPETGDKVCSRCAQKGTIGIVLRQEDMPFTASGIVPDLIMNPHAIPSRMTMNQLLECLGAKIGAIQGRILHSTAFTAHSTDILPTLARQLQAVGFQPHGHERMMCGITGEMMEANIFIGPTYYHRLKHLVSAKIHARNHGNVQMLFRQPCEGRSRDGGLRFGEMERDAVRFDTKISLTCGLSIPVQDMHVGGWSVLSWDASSELVVGSRQVEFLDKGMRECYEMVLEDGRKLYPSIRHPFLTSDGRWLRADEIVPGETVLRVSLESPVLRLHEEIQQCAGWSLLDGKYRTDTSQELLRTMAFARLIGFLTTDGHLSRDGNTCMIWLGHYMDVVACCEDLDTICRCRLFSPELVELCEKSNVYVINLPHSIKKDILQLEGITRGNKTDQPMQFPSFALDPACPLPILREFLGGMFGGDGHTCYLAMHRGKRDQLTSVCFSRSTRFPLLPTLATFFETFVSLLARFDLTKVTLQQPKETTCSKRMVEASQDSRTYSTTLHIDIEHLILFSEKIGFRYCYHKAQRLQAAVCYFRLRNEVKRQHNWLVERVDAITNFSNIKRENPTKKVGTKKAIQKAVEELQQREPLLHEYAIPSTHDITDHLVHGTSFGKFASKSFPTAAEFLQKIDASSLFTGDNDQIRYGTKRGEQGLRAISLKVLSMKPVGEHPVFDIQVADTESFLADGVVAHNCMISHGTSRFLTERLFDMSDPFKIPVCANCGLIPHEPTRCTACGDRSQLGDRVRYTPLPYACKLLFQELMAMGIRVRIGLEDSEPTTLHAPVKEIKLLPASS